MNGFFFRAVFFQSLDIWRAIWEADWHYIDINNQKMIAMLILRGRKAKLVRVPFFEVTLNAYTKVRTIWRI